MSDIIIRFRQGDSTAIKEIYRLAFPACAKLVTNHRGTTDDARDVFQEALVVLHNKVKDPDFALSCTVKTYLYSVVRNLWMRAQDRHKKKGLELIVDEPENEFIIIAEDELEQKKAVEQKHQIIADTMTLISPECQQILLGFYYKKQSLGALAEAMGYSSNFIKVKKGRCMKSLQEKAQRSLANLEKE